MYQQESCSAQSSLCGVRGRGTAPLLILTKLKLHLMSIYSDQVEIAFFSLLLSTANTTWGIAGRDVCLLHVGMPGQEGCYTKIVSL